MLLSWCSIAECDPALGAASETVALQRLVLQPVSLHPFVWLPMQMLDYNVPGGKLNRGMAVLDVVKALRGKVCLLGAVLKVLAHADGPAQLEHYKTRCVLSRCQTEAYKQLQSSIVCSETAAPVAVAQCGPASKLYLCLWQVSPDDVFKANALGWCIEWLQAYFLVADDMMDNSVTRRGQPCWYRNPKVRLLDCVLMSSFTVLATALLIEALVTSLQNAAVLPLLNFLLL